MPALSAWTQYQQTALLRGEIILNAQSHTAWGGACTASMYLPMARLLVWQQVTNYPRWVHYFPDIVESRVLPEAEGLTSGYKRLYQTARKAFLMLAVEVEIYLKAIEVVQQQIQFRMEKGSFVDFSADLKLEDFENGTLLSYSVAATPLIPVPGLLIQQAMHFDLPTNMRKMRQVLCDRA
ncbi:SRPBCC family protein [Oscillatoria sp. FACHB-1406]|uniref:SRPBCC family protein n=1 Tax=Oscillatoria sp. FACHB-1406 TaxID=2692846 RepID=UPI0016829021|nr:SRPBCC family protein [Oscillatoria sp. FACHB-1406]MBD2578251.1 cyclase [Oscillatoria sp. FACHB-1406]